jgi:hypothetical protein
MVLACIKVMPYGFGVVGVLHWKRVGEEQVEVGDDDKGLAGFGEEGKEGQCVRDKDEVDVVDVEEVSLNSDREGELTSD